MNYILTNNNSNHAIKLTTRVVITSSKTVSLCGMAYKLAYLVIQPSMARRSCLKQSDQSIEAIE